MTDSSKENHTTSSQECPSPSSERFSGSWQLIRELPIDSIRLDGGTQARVVIHTLTVDEYTRTMLQGCQFPPVIVYRDGNTLWLADGFHRVYAARQAGLRTIAAEVRPGTRRDAILYAVSANAQHGLRRTNADKRQAVAMLLEDAEWRGWSNREIARRCRVDEGLVRKVRKEFTADNPQLHRTYRNRHGQLGRMRTDQIGKRNEPAFDLLANLPPTLRHQLLDAPITDNPVELRTLAELSSPTRQIAVVERLVSGQAKTVREAIRQLAYAEKQAVTMQEVLIGRFPTVLADPPWTYTNAELCGAAAEHYPTLTTHEICRLPVPEYVCTNAVLFLWATNPLLPDALAVMEEWGFTYKTNMAWVKDRATYGKLGFYAHGQHELLLIGVRGSRLPREGCLPESVLIAAKGSHSEKPEAVYDLIERMYDGPYLELFARQTREGWTSFGNEVRERAATYGKTPAADERGAGTMHVLLVEDDPDLRELFSLLLTVAGCDVTTEASVAGARQQLPAQSWQVLVTDYQLAGGTGDTLIREIHAHRLPIKTILMSALPNVEALAAGCGADCTFAKSSDLSRLVTLVTTLCEQHQERNER